MYAQRRYEVTIPEKKLTMRVSRSGGPGGQSVNMADSRVQLSFHLPSADWIPEKVRAKMKTLHKNRISKKGEITVACQVHSSQLENKKLALQMIQDLVKEAEKGVVDDEWVENEKLDYTDWVIQKKIKEGREKDIEKRAEALKRQKRESRQKTKDKKFMKSHY
jgi:protein subunit release factor B